MLKKLFHQKKEKKQVINNMSSRYEKEKRLRPKNSPYKRDQFVKADYLRIPKTNEKTKSNHLPINEEQQDDQLKNTLVEEEEYDDYEDDDDDDC